MPDFNSLSSLLGYRMSRITQIYLTSEKGVTHRVRSRVTDNTAVYTETKKVRIDAVSSREDEREISESEFYTLIKNIREGSRPVIKNRHVFSYKGKIFEIDEYPEWKKTAIMEIELESREEKIEMPDFLEIVSEVSGDFRYSNSAMSQSFPSESL